MQLGFEQSIVLQNKVEFAEAVAFLARLGRAIFSSQFSMNDPGRQEVVCWSLWKRSTEPSALTHRNRFASSLITMVQR
jgi:hypothetical protein